MLTDSLNWRVQNEIDSILTVSIIPTSPKFRLHVVIVLLM
ncbi:hypothetical protein Leryth_002002, partial [Lithospermum erythrorhizon]